MNFQLSDLYTISAEIFLLCGVSVILLLDLFLSETRRNVTYFLSLFVLVVTSVISLLVFDFEPRVVMNGLVVSGPLSATLKSILCGLIAIGLIYSKDYLQCRGLHRGEYYSLTLFAALGMMVMASSNHFLSLYLGLELLSLSLYAMVALRRDSGRSSEAAIKYFVLGAIASGMLLYGMSMIYGATGNLNIEAIVSSINSGNSDLNLLRLGLVFIIVGVGFKLGAVPFHMWIPDVYQGSPTSVTLLIGTAPKIAAFAFIIRLLAESLGHPSLHQEWSQMLTVLAVASLLIGNVVAIAQTNFKRMLAYSTIAHMGFLLLGFLTGSMNGYSASLFYILTYVFMALAGFGVILLLSKDGFEAEELSDLGGLSRSNPWSAFLLMIVMFSMAGIPPTVGFWSKLFIIQSVIEFESVWLAVVAVMTSLIGAFYYLRVVKIMYFDSNESSTTRIRYRAGLVVFSINGLMLLGMGLFPGWLLLLCQSLIQDSVRVF
ncbi:NADH-quinone oxidoreductase subunit NuoN [Burkholderiales bacterium]|jgi:NADH-quinone oxidoreductase subunit N|nr:NADH-quinone oxidoreductase subunit NuoN [Betaproteobacteria bacterium]MBT6530981.1 NADH-quinone oxidoreductase subunit NuoN [Betaproteobacteria bacterium]MDC3408729.1 NADH-quinone oxidoreductase subunit NuoN [Burkholderiales bacterium]